MGRCGGEERFRAAVQLVRTACGLLSLRRLTSNMVAFDPAWCVVCVRHTVCVHIRALRTYTHGTRIVHTKIHRNDAHFHHERRGQIQNTHTPCGLSPLCEMCCVITGSSHHWRQVRSCVKPWPAVCVRSCFKSWPAVCVLAKACGSVWRNCSGSRRRATNWPTPFSAGNAKHTHTSLKNSSSNRDCAIQNRQGPPAACAVSDQAASVYTFTPACLACSR